MSYVAGGKDAPGGRGDAVARSEQNVCCRGNNPAGGVHSHSVPPVECLMLKRIGTKLYAALGLAALLTLLSGGVGVYYFERSGDLNHRLANESFPAYEGASKASDLAGRIAALGERDFALAAAALEPERSSYGQAEILIEELRQALSRPAGLPGLSEAADRVLGLAWATAGPLWSLDAAADDLWSLRERSDELRIELDLAAAGADDVAAVAVLHSTLSATSFAEVNESWRRYAVLTRGGDLSYMVRFLAESEDGVFPVRYSWLTTSQFVAGLSGTFDEHSDALVTASDELLGEVSARSSSVLDGSLASFDQGRVLLAAVSAASALLVTLVAWVWVGNMVVRRLTQLSERIRAMASGDLDAPMPEGGADEIGVLEDALEVFRRQAIEVQRLNLMERLYGELHGAHEQLQAMQERLVGQEQLAELGEVVDRVADEISNPLGFVKNFSGGSAEFAEEMFEMLDGCRDRLGEDGVEGELKSSLYGVRRSVCRASSIVQRMQSLGVTGGDVSLNELHPVLARAVRIGCETFAAEWGDFTIEPEFELSDKVGEVAIVPRDFTEAVVNLVANACHSLRARRESNCEEGYVPRLRVLSRREGDQVAVVVSDNGIGIPEDIVLRIFDPFFTTRHGALVAGLGLALAADVARRGGGDLTVESEFGVGADFTLTVPASIPASAGEQKEERLGDDVLAARIFCAGHSD